MKKLVFVLLVFCCCIVRGQDASFIKYRVDASCTASDKEQSPLWLTSNRYGINSIEKRQALLRTGVFYHQELKHSMQVNAGLEMVGGKNLVSNFWVHQAYADFSWYVLNLSIGSKERSGFPLEKNELLTSGWLVEGMNTRPVPQVRIEMKDFWEMPFLGNWLAMKGHLAFGKFMDGKWQEDFVAPDQRYVKDALYHSKSIMFRLGNKRKLPAEFEFGILMATQFGGAQYKKNADGTSTQTTKMPNGLKAYWKAFLPQAGGEDNPIAGERMNIEGNVLGSWNFALNTYLGNWKVRATYEHYFEDHSQMFWEYGRWKDGNLGIEITPPKNRWISGVLWEVMSTKDQSGPFEFYDRDTNECLFSGGDGYYNHSIYQAWQYYGSGMGSPLLPGPEYNKDGTISFKSNRMHANHLGIMGEPSNEIRWRVLASFARHWGTYGTPLDKQRKQFSGMAELTYSPKWGKGWNFAATCAMDRGNYLGNSLGGMITVSKTGIFNL